MMTSLSVPSRVQYRGDEPWATTIGEATLSDVVTDAPQEFQKLVLIIRFLPLMHPLSQTFCTPSQPNIAAKA
jgi:hypothetical protein